MVSSSLRLIAAVPVVFVSAKLVSKLLNTLLNPTRTGPPTANVGLLKFFSQIANPQQIIPFLLGLHKTHGHVYRVQTPMFCPEIFVVADWKTLDLILEGNKQLGCEEADKPAFAYRAVSDYTLGIPNIVSKMTNGEGPVHGWAWARKGLAPAFSRNNLYKQLDALQNEVERMVKNLQESSTSLNLTHFVNVHVMRMLCASMFLVDLNDIPERDAASEIINWSDSALIEVMARLSNPLRKFKFWGPSVRMQGADDLMSEAGRMIEMYSSKRSEEEIQKCPSAIGHLLRSPYPDEKTRTAEMSILLLAGAETTAHSIVFTLWEMFKNPQLLQKARSELDAVNPLRGAWDKEKLASLEYIGNVMNEGLRKWPTVPFQLRFLPQDTPCGDFLLPKGSLCPTFFFGAARTGLKDPERFDPDRWSKLSGGQSSGGQTSGGQTVGEDAEQDTLRRFSGFSKGKRNCVGKELALLELKLIIATLIQRIDLDIVKEPEIFAAGTLKPKELMVTASARPSGQAANL